MKAGYYTIRPECREAYTAEHKMNKKFLEVLGDTLHLDKWGTQRESSVFLPDTVMITTNELRYFTYSKTKPVPQRLPKAGETWVGWNCDGSAAYFTIIKVEDNLVHYSVVRPYAKCLKLRHTKYRHRKVNEFVLANQAFSRKVFSH